MNRTARNILPGAFVDAIGPTVTAGRRTSGMSTFAIVLLLVLATFIVTAYISNTFRVDALMIQITQLEKEEQSLIQEQENVRAEINILSSYDNIYRRATMELGLIRSGMQPYQLVVPNLPDTQEAGD